MKIVSINEEFIDVSDIYSIEIPKDCTFEGDWIISVIMKDGKIIKERNFTYGCMVARINYLTGIRIDSRGK